MNILGNLIPFQTRIDAGLTICADEITFCHPLPPAATCTERWNMKRPAKKPRRWKKPTSAEKKEIWKPADNWTEAVGSDTFGYGGRVSKRSTDEDPRGGGGKEG